MRTLTTAVALALAASAATGVGAGQLSYTWMVPAAAHTTGVGGTFWRTDLSLHNPHSYDLPVTVMLLPTGQSNLSAAAADVTLSPYETVNAWDVLGPDVFGLDGTAALIAFADLSLACDPPEECDFLVYSRTYTLVPGDASGEFGQGIPAVASYDGVDWNSYGYAAGILNDGAAFRCNIGVASWTDAWTTVRVDVQDADGYLLDTEEFELPPYGHLQRRMRTAVTGASLVFYLVDGPGDALVFPYASMVNQRTGDPSYVPAIASAVGVSVADMSQSTRHRPALATPRPAGEARALGAQLRQAGARAAR